MAASKTALCLLFSSHIIFHVLRHSEPLHLLCDLSVPDFILRTLSIPLHHPPFMVIIITGLSRISSSGFIMGTSSPQLCNPLLTLLTLSGLPRTLLWWYRYWSVRYTERL